MPATPGATFQFDIHHSELGPLLLAQVADSLINLTFGATPEHSAAQVQRLHDKTGLTPDFAPGQLSSAVTQIEGLISGRLRSYELPWDLRLASPFQHKVLEILPEVTYGTTLTYSNIATKIGQPTAARAVGTALGANPLCLVLPCHRILASSGALSGYAGGLAAKKLLLSREHLQADPGVNRNFANIAQNAAP